MGQDQIPSFQAGDPVLVLLPVPGSALQVSFSGPYKVSVGFVKRTI